MKTIALLISSTVLFGMLLVSVSSCKPPTEYGYWFVFENPRNQQLRLSRKPNFSPEIPPCSTGKFLVIGGDGNKSQYDLTFTDDSGTEIVYKTTVPVPRATGIPEVNVRLPEREIGECQELKTYP
jgi:hypothetical protein